MKSIRLTFMSLAVAALLPALTSCTSDSNPFDVEIPVIKNNSVIQIRFNVEDTRAVDMATSDEKKITKLIVHVFDDKHKLETTKSVDVSNGENIVNLEVSNGLKTLYVVTARSNVNPTIGKNLTDYENTTFNSSLENIKLKDDGFVMVGKSAEQQVMISASKDELPASNIFEIRLVRLVAKAQVKSVNVDGSSLGISFGDASFKVFQLNERMRVLNNGADVFDSYVDSNNNGTYDNYTLGLGDYLNAVTSDFTAGGCAYMSENIVSKPLSGNTTFLSVRFATKPEKYYTFNSEDSSLSSMDETPAASTTYFAVGIQDKVNGIVDYAMDYTSKHILTFKTQTDAENYMNSLNKAGASAMLASGTSKAYRAGAVTEDANTPQFEVIKFNNGYAYYRVNIAHEETSGDNTVKKFKVIRNNFYKVNINSVKGLGFSEESLLRPSNPEAVLDAEGSSWISASITVADWDEVEQGVDLL